MTERTGFIEVADANNIIFTGSKVEDFLIYTETSNQSILIGTLRSNMATIEMRSNIVTINGKLGINISNPSVALEFNTTDAIQIPKGTTEQRPDPTALGQIRYNTSINTFEGFGAGNAWGSLGGVKDTNQDTFVSAESHPTSNDDIIRFYNSNNETMRITKIGRIGISNQSPSERLELNGGNAKFNSNVYILERLGIANSNPTEALEVTGNAKITSNLEIGGNLTVLGSTTTVDATTVNIADNIIRLNNGASFISSLQAGIEVNRGTSLSNYYIIYDEQSKYTKIGEDNKLQVVATRDDDTPINTIAFYDSNNRKYTACNDFVYVDGNLGLGTSNPDTRMEIIGTDAILIPRGTTAQRPPTTKQGQIRYNTSINTFEGFGAGNSWGTLGGVKDINQDTFISAEAYPTSNDDILRFFNSNNETMRIMIDGRIGISNQAPSERLELNGGNAKFNSNIYVLQRQSIGKSNPTEALDIIGNLKASSNIYSINRIGIANSNPTEALDITGNLKASSNLYVLRRQAIGTSNPTEALDITGNLKASSNLYVLRRQAIGTSNPTEALDITGNLKASSNIYSMNRIGIANSNPTEALDITGNLKASSNIYSINRIGIANSNPTEALDITGNLKASSNIYSMNQIGIANSNPTEALDITGNLKASSNIYSMNQIGIANSNPTEALDITGNLKASSNIYSINRIGVANSNPTEALDITGNLKASSNIYSINRIGIANSNPTEALDITGNLKASSNIYSMSRIGVGNSNPTESLDITGNLKASSNIYSMSRIGVANSNPTEALDITGNLKASSNIYSMSRIGVANSNPTESLDITGNLKASSNIYSMSRIGVANSNPTEALDITGNLKASSNIYSMSRIGVANSNPTETLDITGNLKASSNIYSMSRIGVRTSNPAYTLEVIGNISSSNIYLSGSGTATNPSLTWISSSNTGIYLQGKNMNFVSSSSNVLSLSNYKVGILTSQPTELLDIKGNTKVDSNLYVMSNLGIGKSNPQVSLDINGTDAVNIPKGTIGQRPAIPEQGYIRYNTEINTFEGFGAGNVWGTLGGVKDTNQDTYISAESFPTSNDDILRFINSNNETLRIMPSGRVGISNQNPSEMLEVNGNIKISSNIYAGSSISIGKSNISNSNNLDVIGNTAIDGNITSTKYITSRGLQIRNRNGPFFSQGIPSAGTVTGLSNDDSGLILSISEGTSSNYFKFIATSNEILKLTGDGNLINNGWYINTSNYGLCNTTLNTYISPNTSNFGNWMIQGNALGNWNGLRFVQPEISLLCGSNELRQFGVHYNGDGWGLLLDENKNLYIAGDVTSYWSDKRLKENFQEIEDSHDIIQQLTGFRFNWNEKGQRILNKTAEETEVGLIAQDVQRVIPQAVKVNKSSLSLNNENGDENNEYLTINYDKIIPFLIQGYKRHTKEIEELKTIIKELLPKQ
jgi:hypothetical protein